MPPTLEESLPPPPQEVPPIPPNYIPPKPAEAPVIRKSPFRFIIPALIVLVVVGLIGFAISKMLSIKKSSSTNSSKTPITINYWGLWESPSIFKPVIDAFELENPNIKINYQAQGPADYQDRALTAIDSASTPDIVRLHSTWLPMFYTKLYPAPQSTISPTEISTNFYPSASQVVIGGNVYGVPITMDGLGLYVNTSMLDSVSVSIPRTWEDLQSAAKTLTTRDPNTGKITRAGVALGNTKNVDHWPDIVTLMLLQGGANLLSPDPTNLESTIRYYTSFALGADPVWDDTLPGSIVAFATNKVAMIIAPLWRASDIQALNPSLVWRVVPVPQLPDIEPVNWTSFWIESVPKNSKHKDEAWKFITYLGSAKAQQLLFENATRERGYSQVPANKAVAQLAQQNPIAAPFVESMPTAKSFYTASHTRDSETSINSRLIKYLEDTINSMNPNQSQSGATQTLINGFNQVLSQYRLVTPAPSVAP